jgi:hypothetical protein
MRTRDCKKCGNTGIMPSYNSGTDKLDFKCLCGFGWSEPVIVANDIPGESEATK